jgi:hypothetical protein
VRRGKAARRQGDERYAFCDERQCRAYGRRMRLLDRHSDFEGAVLMRGAVLAVVAACALAACGQSTEQQSAGSSGGLFPDLTRTAYRAEATITSEDGDAMPIVMIRDGRKSRVEVTSGDGAYTMISNGDTGETFVLTSQGGRMMAIRSRGESEGFTDPAEAWQGELSENATRTGTCSVAGENGAEWTKTTAEDGTDTVCVTEDGIILRATDDGRVVWETTSVQRGAQSADLFVLPEGVQAIDAGNFGGLLNDAIEAAKQRGN